jgi:KDO2-lipid IV(A) lauroyltransferase
MKAKNPLKIHAEYLLFSALVRGIGFLPRPLAIGLGRGLARIAYAIMGHLRHVGMKNLGIAFPHMSRPERLRILRKSFDSLGRQLGEFCRFPHASKESLGRIVEYDPGSVARLEEAERHGCGVLFVTAHLGAWELLAFAHSALVHPLSFLVRPLDNPLIERVVHSMRTRFGNQAVSKKDAGLTCMRKLKHGGTLGILADLNSLQEEGIFVPFFGTLACSTAAVAALALATGAAVFPAFAPWDPVRKKYIFLGGPVVEVLRTGDFARDLGVNTARIAQAIESVIRKYPEQWLWIHDRWHTRPRPQDRVCADFPHLSFW